MTEELELQCCHLISAAGCARSDFLEAIQKASEADFEGADQLIASGNRRLGEGHKIHTVMLADDAAGDNRYGGLLVMHTEDQMMSVETFGIIAEQFIDLYKKLVKVSALVTEGQ